MSCPIEPDKRAEELGLPVAGRLVSAAVAGVDPSVMGRGLVKYGVLLLSGLGLWTLCPTL